MLLLRKSSQRTVS